MPDAVTDTHSLIWYLEDDPQLGVNASRVFDDCDRGAAVIYIPTICLVEIVYLQEKGRISAGLKAQLDAELQANTTGLALVNLTEEIVNTLMQISRAEIPEMPDRIIAATGLHLGLPVISRDHKIQSSIVATIW